MLVLPTPLVINYGHSLLACHRLLYEAIRRQNTNYIELKQLIVDTNFLHVSKCPVDAMWGRGLWSGDGADGLH